MCNNLDNEVRKLSEAVISNLRTYRCSRRLYLASESQYMVVCISIGSLVGNHLTVRPGRARKKSGERVVVVDGSE